MWHLRCRGAQKLNSEAPEKKHNLTSAEDRATLKVWGTIMKEGLESTEGVKSVDECDRRT